jgi:hypothetical protein
MCFGHQARRNHLAFQKAGVVGESLLIRSLATLSARQTRRMLYALVGIRPELLLTSLNVQQILLFVVRAS